MKKRLTVGLTAILGVGSVAALSGCARTLTITQADYINTAMHRNRPVASRTGQLLEINVVCVYPSDLEKPQNAPLAPDAGITSDVWYKYRPSAGRMPGPGTFDLPPKQIYLLTDEQEGYGKRVARRLGGALKDGKKSVKITGIQFSKRGWGKFAGEIYARRSVIYVFPKFIGPSGKVLPVAPAVFNPPGAYRRDLYVEIDVNDRGGEEIQVIRNTTNR